MRQDSLLIDSKRSRELAIQKTKQIQENKALLKEPFIISLEKKIDEMMRAGLMTSNLAKKLLCITIRSEYKDIFDSNLGHTKKYFDENPAHTNLNIDSFIEICTRLTPKDVQRANKILEANQSLDTILKSSSSDERIYIINPEYNFILVGGKGVGVPSNFHHPETSEDIGYLSQYIKNKPLRALVLSNSYTIDDIIECVYHDPCFNPEVADYSGNEPLANLVIKTTYFPKSIIDVDGYFDYQVEPLDQLETLLVDINTFQIPFN